MNTTTDAMNEQMTKMGEMQSKMFEPMKIFGGLAVETMDHVMRKHYAVMGDMVEYTLKQARLPMSGVDMNAMAQTSMADATAFGELLGTRANEYAQIANDFGAKAKAASEQATASARPAV